MFIKRGDERLGQGYSPRNIPTLPPEPPPRRPT
jgi:hypothetical protein